MGNAIRQEITKERTGGWTVLTWVNGTLRCQTWTAGSRKDATATAREDAARFAVGSAR